MFGLIYFFIIKFKIASYLLLAFQYLKQVRIGAINHGCYNLSFADSYNFYSAKKKKKKKKKIENFEYFIQKHIVPILSPYKVSILQEMKFDTNSNYLKNYFENFLTFEDCLSEIKLK